MFQQKARVHPDTTFGSYRLIELLGQGAMGSVWRALDLRLEREVALKVLRDVDEVRHRALVTEAKLACQLNHPNIAHIYEAGEVDGVPFIAMELVEGSTLRAHVGQHASEDWLVRVASQAGGALQQAHAKGIVHRDIKPENLVLTQEGALKILDFGIARLLQGGERLGATGHHATLIERTAPGYSQGTPAYMSPEQANGHALTGASDQFSLGVVLYELATGHHPFLRASLVETLFAVVKDPVKPLSALRPDLSADFDGALDRMLSKEPEDRFPTLLEAVTALRGGSPEAGTTLRAPILPAPRSRPWVLAGMALGLVALGGGGAWWLMAHTRVLSGLAAARDAAGKDFAKGRRVVAVLPLEQMVPDPELAWLSNSFADAMSTGLLQREDVLVVDRLRVQEIMAQLGEVPGKPLKAFGALAKTLRAESMVQGSYQVVGERLRVSVRLLDPATGQALHQFQLEGTKDRMLDVEDQLQRRLPTELGLGAAGGGVRSRATNPRTRELYAKGSQVLTEGNLDSLHLAKGYFEQALGLEPDYAPAHAGLAWALQELGATTSLSLGRFEEGQRYFKQGRDEAEKAIALDPTVSQAYRALSAVLMRQGDLESASKAALQAIRIDPADTRAYSVLADVFAALDGEENYLAARRYFEKALQLDPDSWTTHHRFAVLLQNNGVLEQAARHAEKAVAQRPTAEFAYVTLADALIWMGRDAEAETRLYAGLRQVPGSNVLKSLLAITACDRGDARAVDESVKALAGVWPEQHSGPVLLKGLVRAVRKDRAGTAQIYQAYLKSLQGTDWSTKRHNEKRVTSVNLYFMARTLARLGDRNAARPFVDLAERLHTGKKRVMASDPTFRP